MEKTQKIFQQKKIQIKFNRLVKKLGFNPLNYGFDNGLLVNNRYFYLWAGDLILQIGSYRNKAHTHIHFKSLSIENELFTAKYLIEKSKFEEIIFKFSDTFRKN